jgi:hypothetical protein
LASWLSNRTEFSTMSRIPANFDTPEGSAPSGMEYDLTSFLARAKNIVEKRDGAFGGGANYPLITEGATEAEALQSMEQLLHATPKNLQACRALLAASPPFSCTVSFDIERSFFSLLGNAWSNVLLAGTVLAAMMKVSMARSVASTKEVVHSSQSAGGDIQMGDIYPPAGRGMDTSVTRSNGQPQNEDSL